jgi:hypothetical protein
MSSKSVVHKDAKGLFVKAGGYVARPGGVRGYDHAYRMDDGGLKEGDRVKARHKAQTPLTVITLDDGTKLHWHHEAKHIVYNYDKKITDAPPDPCFYEECGGDLHEKIYETACGQEVTCTALPKFCAHCSKPIVLAPACRRCSSTDHTTGWHDANEARSIDAKPAVPLKVTTAIELRDRIMQRVQTHEIDKAYTFEIRILCSVTEKGHTPEEALQKIAEHFDGHIITKEITGTLDSDCDPVLFEIDGREVPRVRIPIDTPEDEVKPT